MWGGPNMDLVRPDLFNRTSGASHVGRGAAAGYYFGKNKYMQVTDPQCSSVTSSLQTLCATNMHALAIVDHLDSNGNPVAGAIVLQRAKPGTAGNFKPNTINGPGKLGLDMTAGKNIEILEGKSLNIRIDAQNVLNHPTPSGSAPYSYNNRNYATGNPVMDIGSTTQPFGYIAYKGGHRVFSAKVRLTF